MSIVLLFKILKFIKQFYQYFVEIIEDCIVLYTCIRTINKQCDIPVHEVDKDVYGCTTTYLRFRN